MTNLQLMTVREAARELDVPTQTVYRWIGESLLVPFGQVIGRAVLIPAEQVRKLKEQRETAKVNKEARG